ncbi:hypothetical protein ACHAXR_005159 [Thalassiosira sp. AJA248-18]
MTLASFLASAAAWCLVAHAQFPFFASAFQPICRLPVSRTLHKTRATTQLHLVPEIHTSIAQIPLSLPPSTSILLSSDDVASWRQYVSLAVVVGVLIDIVLGSPLANLVLAPMKRASEKGASGKSTDSNEDDGGSDSGGLFSSFSGNSGSSGADKSRGRERVDSEAIAQAALDKAMGTLELKRFLEENKTDEQRYEDVRKKIDQQMQELEEDL